MAFVLGMSIVLSCSSPKTFRYMIVAPMIGLPFGTMLWASLVSIDVTSLSLKSALCCNVFGYGLTCFLISKLDG